MDFTLTQELRLIQETARNFSQDRLKPHAMAWEEEKRLDIPTMQAAAALGFAGLYVREDVGGSALSRLTAALVFEEMARGCVSTSTFISIHNMASWMIDCYGTPEQRQRWLPRLTRMETIASYCLTEPGSGSDAASLRTRAVRSDDHYVLEGSKAFISGAGLSDIYVVMARTGEAGPRGISAFVVEKGMQGLSFGANEKKMGWHAQPTALVNFDACKVPAANRLGAEGEGFKIAMSGLDGGRINIGAASLGGAQEALERAARYAGERKQFGQPIAAFQATQFKLADMETELDAARLMLYRAASALDANDPNKTKYAAMAKRLATDTGFAVANHALQIHGGYGYLKDYEIERIVRDLRVHQILEGTNEIMRVIIAREQQRTGF
jgi:alkylation response protein AidB-like acyl-CoA dehydrogenase